MTKNPSRVALDHCVIHVSDWERFDPCGKGRSVYFRDPGGSLLELTSYDGDGQRLSQSRGGMIARQASQ